MTEFCFLVERLRPIFSIRLPLFLSMVICLTICANAQDSQQSLAAAAEDATSGLVEGVVSDVQGTSLRVAGNILIDISRASIISPGGESLNISIKPGMCIRAHIVGASAGEAALIADVVRVQTEDRIILSGFVQEANLDQGYIILLDRRILITSATVIPIGPPRIVKIKAGKPISVVVKLSGTDFVATRVFPSLLLPTIFP